MEKFSWADRVRNDELHRVKEKNNILHTTKKKRKVHRITHLLRKKCPLKHISEGKIEERIEVTGRRGRRCKQRLDDLRETRGYWKLKQEALNYTMRRTHFGICDGPVV